MTWELKQYSAAIGLPIAYVYAVIPASGLLICLFSLVKVLAQVAGDSD
jgi:TRAP-type C4-dicarboxylate transport system permease small subunit